MCADHAWGGPFSVGSMMNVSGGTTISVNTDGVVKLDDLYFPPLIIEIPPAFFTECLTPVDKPRGDNDRGLVLCNHLAHDIDCLLCWVRYWRSFARANDVRIDVPVVGGRPEWVK